jgi:hypothetical protein
MMLKSQLLNLLSKVLAYRGYSVKKTTDKHRVEALIKSLFPIDTNYGLIRLGPLGDGGYLVPNVLGGIEACFSPGVSDISGFELDCITRGMKVFMADYSVEKPNLYGYEGRYNFLKKFIGHTENEKYITMDTWVKLSPVSSSSDLLLQMDIEGGEYFSLINMSDSLLKRFKIMVIEFHYLHELWDEHFFMLAESVFAKILNTHKCVHIHPNNCCAVYNFQRVSIPPVMEFSFIRSDLVTNINYASNFPHKLDFDNTSNHTVTLPLNWHN